MTDAQQILEHLNSTGDCVECGKKEHQMTPIWNQYIQQVIFFCPHCLKAYAEDIIEEQEMDEDSHLCGDCGEESCNCDEVEG